MLGKRIEMKLASNQYFEAILSNLSYFEIIFYKTYKLFAFAAILVHLSSPIPFARSNNLIITKDNRISFDHHIIYIFNSV